MLRRGRARALAWVVCLGVWSLAELPGPALAQSGALRVGLPSLPASLDPATAVEAPAALVVRQVFDTLVRYREGGSDVEPGLAIQWSVAKDGLVWTFRLREGVRFHDGTPLTAQHVVASLERQVFPGQPGAPSAPTVAPRLLRGSPGVVREIKALDTRTVRIQLGLPYAALLSVLAHPGLSVALQGTGDDGAPRWLGSGPFAVAEIGPGRIILEANRAHWAGPPRLARLVFTATDDARAVADLDARALDVWIPEGTPSRAAGAVSVPGWRIGYLALQTEKDPLSRRKARQAIAAAIDPGQVGSAMERSATPLQSFLPPGLWGGRTGASITLGDPAAARKLLGEAGLARGLSSTLLLLGGAGAEEQARLGEVIRSALGAAGIALQLQPLAAGDIMPLVQNGEHQMALMEARAEAGDPHFLLYPLSASEAAVKGPAAWNLSFYRNARLDDLLIRASQLSFRPERQRVYGRAQATLAEDLPWIPLYVRLLWAVARPEVRNLRLHPSGQHRLDRVTLEPPS